MDRLSSLTVALFMTVLVFVGSAVAWYHRPYEAALHATLWYFLLFTSFHFYLEARDS
jgi:hypothetical protein